MNATDEHGRTVLHRVAIREVADAIISAGANVNALDNDGKSALMDAVMWARLPIVELQVALPMSVGRQLGLVEGSTLIVESETDSTSYLSVQQTEPRLIEKNGVLMVESRSPCSVKDITRHERDQRDDDLVNRIGL